LLDLQCLLLEKYSFLHRMTRAQEKKFNRTELPLPFGKPMDPQKIKNAALDKRTQLF
jgi:hypothetical protein